jgi:hypothetical protein
MFARGRKPLEIAALVLTLTVICATSGAAQNLHNMVASQSRVFPQAGGGIIAMQEDASGRVYVLANPGKTIQVFDAKGDPAGQIPNANSGGATLRFAIGLDVAPNGNLLVADRGANSVYIFTPDGTVKAKVTVLLPTSIVALSNGQFAVTTLRTEHPVEVIDQTGRIVRGFGEAHESTNSEDAAAAPPPPLADLGRIVGDSADNLYFAVLSTDNPQVRKFDRFGYASYAASVPLPSDLQSNDFDDRVQLSFNFNRLSRSDQINSFATLGDTGRVQFGGGVGMGLAGLMASQDRGGRGGGSGTVGAAVTVDTSLEQSTFDMHVGMTANSRGGRGAAGPAGGPGRGPAGAGQQASGASQSSSDAATLEYLAADTAPSPDTGSDSTSPSNGSYSNTLQYSAPAAAPTDSSNTVPGTLDYMVGTPQSGLGSGGGGFSSFFLGGNGPGPGGGFGRPFLDGGARFGADRGGLAAGQAFTTPMPSSAKPTFGGSSTGAIGDLGALGSGGSGAKAPGSGGFGPGGSGYGRGRFGGSDLSFATTLRINLDHPHPVNLTQKTLTAVGVDRKTQEIWTAMGPVLDHFNNDGDLMDTYYLTTPEGALLQTTAIVVEPDRLLIGSNAGGVYGFARPDKAAPAKSVQAAAQTSKTPAQ